MKKYFVYYTLVCKKIVEKILKINHNFLFQIQFLNFTPLISQTKSEIKEKTVFLPEFSSRSKSVFLGISKLFCLLA